MELKKYNVYYFFFILAIVSAVTYFIFKPFLMTILLAAILAVILQRPYNFFLKVSKDKRKTCAFFIALLGIIIFGFLFLGLIGLIINEVSNLYQGASIDGGVYQQYLNQIIGNINDNSFLKSLGLNNLINKDTFKTLISQIGQNAFSILQQTYQSVAHILFTTLIMFFTLYYFLIGGKELVSKIMFLSPLKNSHERILIDKFISISRATVKGTLVIGLIQGTIGAILFSVVGIHASIIWGLAMMFFSLIPLVGTGIIWLPAALIMLLLGNVWQAITIFVVGFGVISTIDNFLKPRLVGKDTQMHPLMILFATLGGISLFGFAGFIAGPVIVALFLSLWEIYGVEFKTQLKRCNS